MPIPGKKVSELKVKSASSFLTFFGAGRSLLLLLLVGGGGRRRVAVLARGGDGGRCVVGAVEEVLRKGSGLNALQG